MATDCELHMDYRPLPKLWNLLIPHEAPWAGPESYVNSCELNWETLDGVEGPWPGRAGVRVSRETKTALNWKQLCLKAGAIATSSVTGSQNLMPMTWRRSLFRLVLCIWLAGSQSRKDMVKGKNGQNTACALINRRLAKRNVVCVRHGIVLTIRKDTFWQNRTSGKYNAGWNK